MAGVHETDVLLHSAVPGSVMFLWKFYSHMPVNLPQCITPVLKKICLEVGITHMGLIMDHIIKMIDIQELKVEGLCICFYK